MAATCNMHMLYNTHTCLKSSLTAMGNSLKGHSAVARTRSGVVEGREYTTENRVALKVSGITSHHVSIRGR